MVIIPLITRRSILMDILMQEILVFPNTIGEGTFIRSILKVNILYTHGNKFSFNL